MQDHTTITPADALALIAQGENQAIEFKQTWPRPEQMAREITALANSGGGTILMGVADNGTVMGINPSTLGKETDPKEPSSHSPEEWLMNIARSSISPALQVSYQSIAIEGKSIAIVHVPKGRDKPYQTGDKYYIRVGSTNRSPTQAELMRLYQLAGVFHYDATAVSNTSANDLNQAAIDDYFGSYSIEFSKETVDEKNNILRNADITTPAGECTIAGLLCFGINPTRYLPQAGISFAHFNGLDVTAPLIDKQNISGALPHIIDTALAVIKNNLQTPSTILGAHRHNTHTHPSDKALRELLVNACVHRNYSITGSSIRLFMFNDRLECHSPGRLPNTISVDKLRVGVSYASNPVITKFMDNLRYIDRLGRGFPLLYQEAKRLGGELQVKEVGDFLLVTLPLV